MYLIYVNTPLLLSLINQSAATLKLLLSYRYLPLCHPFFLPLSLCQLNKSANSALLFECTTHTHTGRS